MLLLEKKTKFIKLCTKFCVKEAKFLTCNCTSFTAAQHASTANLPAFFPKFLKIVHALTVNEIKLLSRNTFIFNLFALESENESKKGQKNVLLGLSAES